MDYTTMSILTWLIYTQAVHIHIKTINCVLAGDRLSRLQNNIRYQYGNAHMGEVLLGDGGGSGHGFRRRGGFA